MVFTKGKKDNVVVFTKEKRQRGGNLAKKTTNKILHEFAKAKNYIADMTKKGVSTVNKKNKSNRQVYSSS